MAIITRLDGVPRRNSTVPLLIRAVKECVAFPFCMVLVACFLPLCIFMLICSSTSTVVSHLTGSHPIAFSFRLGEVEPIDS